LQEKYADRGFTVLAFPTNDFHQEQGSNEAIQLFVKEKYPQVSFPIFGKSSLASNPVYQRLERHLPNDYVKHNFFKYLVNRKGRAVKLYDKKTPPMSLQEAIEELLAEDAPPKMTTE
jgi:glutathione peroxidase